MREKKTNKTEAKVGKKLKKYDNVTFIQPTQRSMLI